MHLSSRWDSDSCVEWQQGSLDPSPLSPFAFPAGPHQLWAHLPLQVRGPPTPGGTPWAGLSVALPCPGSWDCALDNWMDGWMDEPWSRGHWVTGRAAWVNAGVNAGVRGC